MNMDPSSSMHPLTLLTCNLQFLTKEKSRSQGFRGVTYLSIIEESPEMLEAQKPYQIIRPKQKRSQVKDIKSLHAPFSGSLSLSRQMYDLIQKAENY